jgi:hypothetical protein
MRSGRGGGIEADARWAAIEWRIGLLAAKGHRSTALNQWIAAAALATMGSARRMFAMRSQ